jgi:hypothetical protein
MGFDTTLFSQKVALVDSNVLDFIHGVCGFNKVKECPE